MLVLQILDYLPYFLNEKVEVPSNKAIRIKDPACFCLVLFCFVEISKLVF